MVARALKRGNSKIKLRVKEDCHCYPNICVPLAGIIDYYKTKEAVEFIPGKSWTNSSSNYIGILEPYEFGKTNPPDSFLGKIWKFSPETQYEIVSGIVESLRRSSTVGKDILLGFELALNEVTDNTLLHSIPNSCKDAPTGFVMVQYAKHYSHIIAAVFDTGQGIASSLREGGVSIHNDEEALQMAIRRGTTSGNGAGNGLWMMEQIVLASSGSFNLSSNGVKYSLRHESAQNPRLTSVNITRIKSGTTLVDFQINCQNDISLEDALGDSHVDLWTESHLANNENDLVLIVKDESHGYASRIEGKHFSNIVINSCKSIQGKCILDFSDIDIISASFADQLITDLICELSFIGFLNRIEFIRLTRTCATVINTAFATHYFNDSQVVV